MASTQTEELMRSPAATTSLTSAATPTDARDWCGRLQGSESSCSPLTQPVQSSGLGHAHTALHVPCQQQRRLHAPRLHTRGGPQQMPQLKQASALERKDVARSQT